MWWYKLSDVLFKPSKQWISKKRFSVLVTSSIGIENREIFP